MEQHTQAFNSSAVGTLVGGAQWWHHSLIFSHRHHAEMISLRGFRSAQLLSGQSLCQQRYRSEQHLNEQILITFRQALQSPRHLLTSSNGKKSVCVRESERMNESVLSSNESLVMSDFNNLQPHLLPDNLSVAFDVCVHVVNKWSEWLECMGSDVSTRWFGLLQADPCWEPLCYAAFQSNSDIITLY